MGTIISFPFIQYLSSTTSIYLSNCSCSPDQMGVSQDLPHLSVTYVTDSPSVSTANPLAPLTTTLASFFFLYLLSAHSPAFPCPAQIFYTARRLTAKVFTRVAPGHPLQWSHTVYGMEFNFLKLDFKGLRALCLNTFCTFSLFPRANSLNQ